MRKRIGPSAWRGSRLRPATLLLATLALVACAGPTERSAEANGVTPSVAIMAPITGSAASAGTQQVNFARLAVEDFNQAHGTSYTLVEGDTRLDPARSVGVAQRLVGDPQVYAVVGPAGTQEMAAVAPLLAQSTLPLVSPSATGADLTEQGYRHVFRVVPRDDVQGPTSAGFIADRLGARKVWIVDDRSAYSSGLAFQAEQALAERRVTVVRQSIGQSDTDFAALVTRIKADAPDAVFLPWQLAAQGARFARQMAEQGARIQLVGADGLFSPTEFIGGAAGAAEGAYVSFFAPDVSSVEDARPVVEAYRARHGEVGPFGAPAYVATTVTLEAMERARAKGSLSRAGVRAELFRTDQASSVLGTPIAFDAKGDVREGRFFLFQVRQGQFVPVAPSAEQATQLSRPEGRARGWLTGPLLRAAAGSPGIPNR